MLTLTRDKIRIAEIFDDMERRFIERPPSRRAVLAVLGKIKQAYPFGTA